MTPRRWFDEVTPWFEKAWRDYGPDLDVTWELGMTSLPDPAKENRFTTAFTLYAHIPTETDGVFLAITVMMSPGFDEAKVAETVRDLVVNLRESISLREAEHREGTPVTSATVPRP